MRLHHCTGLAVVVEGGPTLHNTQRGRIRRRARQPERGSGSLAVPEALELLLKVLISSGDLRRNPFAEVMSRNMGVLTVQDLTEILVTLRTELGLFHVLNIPSQPVCCTL